MGGSCGRCAKSVPLDVFSPSTVDGRGETDWLEGTWQAGDEHSQVSFSLKVSMPIVGRTMTGDYSCDGACSSKVLDAVYWRAANGRSNNWVLDGVWERMSTRDRGLLHFEFDRAGRRFNGRWMFGDVHGPWNGWKVTSGGATGAPDGTYNTSPGPTYQPSMIELKLRTGSTLISGAIVNGEYTMKADQGKVDGVIINTDKGWRFLAQTKKSDNPKDRGLMMSTVETAGSGEASLVCSFSSGDQRSRFVLTRSDM